MITKPSGLKPIDPSSYLTSQSELTTGNPSVMMKTCPSILCQLCEYGCTCSLSWWC